MLPDSAKRPAAIVERDDEAAMRILLWKIGALGDVVMTTPLVRQLRVRLPSAHIDYLVGRPFASALEGNPHLDQIVTFDERVFYKGQVNRLGAIREKLIGYDAVYILDKHWIFTWVAWWARIPVRVGFRRRAAEGFPLTHTVPYGGLRHEVDYYLDLLDAVGLGADRADVGLDAPAVASEDPGLRDHAGATVLINSGGSNANEDSTVRRMPDSLFGDLVRACAAQGQVVFLGSSAEHPFYAQFASNRCANLCGRTSLAQAVTLLRHAQRVITTDSGLMHLAAAVSSQVTSVFGPTHPLRKCPPGARWVWGDQDTYDSRYEVFGSVPRGRYFASLTVSDIMEKARPSPLPAIRQQVSA